jgi:hypothetical protein
MDANTYSDPHVMRLLQEQYITVKVDQDARPDLSSRYEEYVGVTHRFNQLISTRPEARYEYAYSARPWDNGTRRGQLMFAIDAILRF